MLILLLSIIWFGGLFVLVVGLIWMENNRRRAAMREFISEVERQSFERTIDGQKIRFVESNHVAEALGITPEYLHSLEREHIRPARKIDRRRRMYSLKEVEVLAWMGVGGRPYRLGSVSAARSKARPWREAEVVI